MWLAIGATAVGLLLGYLLKAQCAAHPWVDKFEYRRLCYNDIQPLFHVRGVGEGLLPYRDVVLEYPVLTGTFMYVAGRLLSAAAETGTVRNNDPNYFHLTALLLAPFGLVVSLKLRPFVTRSRMILWAVGPPVILYSFHNWDLLAVAGGVWGLVELERRRLGGSGAALGLGASAKLFPAFFLPGALLDPWSRKDRAGAGRVWLGFVATAALVNVPWILISWDGWLSIWAFHARRLPDFGTLWFWLAEHLRPLSVPWLAPGTSSFRNLVGLLSLILFTGGSAWLIWKGWGRRGERQGYPVAATGLGVLALFLLVSKVHSPQYALWMLPLLAMVDVPWWLVASYLASDLSVYVTGFYWFVEFDSPATAWRGIFEAAVLLRAVAIAGLLWWSTRARRLEPAA